MNISTLIGQALPQTAEKSKVTASRKPSSSSSTSYRQPGYIEDNKHQSKKSAPFEDNLGLSEEEEDIMLAQCIKSGMPKVKIYSFIFSFYISNFRWIKLYGSFTIRRR